jgi:Concanavalin A-like lectin/glucanases superfamily
MGLLSTLSAASARAYGFTRSAVAAAVDAYFNRTTLLLNTSSTNGAQNNTFLDSSTNNFTITRNGNTTQGTFTPFSQTGWSNYFNGSSTISFGSNSALNILAYDTFECWVNMPVIGTNDLIAGKDGNFWMGYNFTGIGGTANKFVFSIWTGSSWQAVSSTTTPVVGVWYHLLGVKDNTTMRFYVNGVQENTSTFSGSPVTTGTFYVASNNNIENFEGYISNLRLITGASNTVFPYSGLTTGSSFTPPTSALTAVTGTALLTCQSNRFVDNSSNNLSATIISIPSVQAFSPFAPTAAYDAAVVGGSMYNSATPDGLKFLTSTTQFGISGDFTIELWFYPTAAPSAYNTIWGVADSSASDNPMFALFYNGSYNLFWLNNGAGGNGFDSGAGINIIPNQWNHIAISRSGSDIRCWTNGVLRISNWGTGAIDTNKRILYIGTNRTGSDTAPGYISGFRFVNGSAVYSGASNFTPPTTPPTAITNTVALVNSTNAGIYDSTAKNDLQTVGNAQVSTTQAKWGTTSLYCPATNGNYFVGSPNQPNLLFGTGNFTVEAWIYPTAFTNTATGLIGYGLSGGYVDWNLEINTSGNVLYIDNDAGRFSSSSNLSTNTWTHIAIVRTNTAVTMYFNGTSVGSYSTINNISGSSTSARLYVGTGAQQPGSRQFIGYIDDPRITKGYARYTTNFTPPSAAFQLQ